MSRFVCTAPPLKERFDNNNNSKELHNTKHKKKAPSSGPCFLRFDCDNRKGTWAVPWHEKKKSLVGMLEKIPYFYLVAILYTVIIHGVRRVG